MNRVWFYEFPPGMLGIAEADGFVTGVFFAENGKIPAGLSAPGYEKKESPLIKKTAFRLERYFAGKLKLFDLPLKPAGTDFQKSVWNALLEIPYGETRTYSEIAAQAGNPKACRAAGMANNKNPIVIIIPCHRVIGKDDSLTGYGGGLKIKQYLLDLEKNSRIL